MSHDKPPIRFRPPAQPSRVGRCTWCMLDSCLTLAQMVDGRLRA
jgi:hypothetical protein